MVCPADFGLTYQQGVVNTRYTIPCGKETGETRRTRKFMMDSSWSCDRVEILI